MCVDTNVVYIVYAIVTACSDRVCIVASTTRSSFCNERTVVVSARTQTRRIFADCPSPMAASIECVQDVRQTFERYKCSP